MFVQILLNEEPRMRPKHAPQFQRVLDYVSNIIYGTLGFALCAVAFTLTVFSAIETFSNFAFDNRSSLLSFVSYLIISVAVFDVGRYLLEEEVLRDRELRSPKEARQSITKFMVIIIIAVTLESLLHILQIEQNLEDIIFPALMLFIGAILLVSLGIFQKLSSSTERELDEQSKKQESEQKADLENTELSSDEVPLRTLIPQKFRHIFPMSR